MDALDTNFHKLQCRNYYLRFLQSLAVNRIPIPSSYSTDDLGYPRYHARLSRLSIRTNRLQCAIPSAHTQQVAHVASFHHRADVSTVLHFTTVNITRLHSITVHNNCLHTIMAHLYCPHSSKDHLILSALDQDSLDTPPTPKHFTFIFQGLVPYGHTPACLHISQITVLILFRELTKSL
jgi:hypothetical protein